MKVNIDDHNKRLYTDYFVLRIFGECYQHVSCVMFHVHKDYWRLSCKEIRVAHPVNMCSLVMVITGVW